MDLVLGLAGAVIFVYLVARFGFVLLRFFGKILLYGVLPILGIVFLWLIL